MGKNKSKIVRFFNWFRILDSIQSRDVSSCDKRKTEEIVEISKQLVISPRREHSRKPDEMYTYIEQLLDGPYIELFARTTKEGWDNWGNEVTKFKDTEI